MQRERRGWSAYIGAVTTGFVVLLGGCASGSASAGRVPQGSLAARVLQQAGQPTCTTEMRYYGPEVGDTVTVAPGQAVAGYTRTLSDWEVMYVASRSTTVRFGGRTAEKTYTFSVEATESEGGAQAGQRPAREISIYHETDPTRVQAAGIEFDMFADGANIRIEMVSHPEPREEPCNR